MEGVRARLTSDPEIPLNLPRQRHHPPRRSDQPQPSFLQGHVSAHPGIGAAIPQTRAAFDEKTVTASGTAQEVSSRASRRGNPYTTFRLSDKGEAVKVFTFGTPAIKDGDRVEVRSVFQRVKQVGAYTFHDEIDASSVTPAK